MPNHPDLPFSDWHKGRFDAGTDSEVPLIPEGTGDLFYAFDTQTLYIADEDGTAWNAYPMGGAVNPVHNLYDFSDVESAGIYSGYVLATGDGITGGEYQGRRLVADDLPDNLNAAEFPDGVLRSDQGGTGTGSPGTGSWMVGDNLGGLTPFPVATNGQFLVTYQSGFSVGFTDGYGISGGFSSGFDQGFNGKSGFSSGFSGGINGYTKGGGIRYQTYDVDTTFYGCRTNGANSVTSGTLTTIDLSVLTEDFDTDNMLDTGTFPTRITFNHEGYWMILVFIGGTHNTNYLADSAFDLIIRKGGTTIIAETRLTDNFGTVYFMSVGDYIEFRVNDPFTPPSPINEQVYVQAYRLSRQ